ncbi:MAG: insulinase family protein, partial [Acidimicrobiia bacterium]|nr:insulinase family protein [Acidimicrobiia bacterium]
MADDVLEVEIDGVPVLWVPSDSRHLTGGIIVRVGLSDEAFVRRGFTHLIEHLALSTLNVDYDYNGFVDSTTTNFIARGSPDDVLHFVDSVVAALSNLPYDRLDVERRVLVAESERNGVSSAASALAVLYGANGVGSMALPEMGLWQATPATLEHWLEEWFTLQNMVMWFAGPEPLRPSLAGMRRGRRRPTVRMQRRPLAEPVYFVDSVPGPGVVNVMDRSPLVAAGLAMVTDRLTERLRTTEGMSYSVNSNLQPLNASATLLTLAADCRAADVDDVFSIMVMELNRFAFEGPTAQEVDDYVRKRRRLVDDDGAPVARASTAAYHRLQGASTIDPIEELAQVEAAPRAAFAAAVHDITRSAMWVVPPGATVRDQRFTPV